MSSSPFQTLTGTIIRRKLGKGKQKEEMVNAILTEQGLDIVIRREGTTAFRDTLIENLIGKQCTISGIRQSFVLIAETIDLVEKVKEEAITYDLSQDFGIAK
jgi:hypothetical protein